MASFSPLLALPDEIKRLILEDLSLSDFHSLGNLRLCSRAWNAAAEEFFYRTVSFHELNNTEKSAELIVRLAERLTDPDDALRTHVRHLKIGPTREVLPSNEDRRRLPDHEYRPLPKGLLVPHVTGILENLRRLSDFSWHIYNKVPKDILDGIEARWPDCRLHAYYPDANHRQMNDFDNEFLCSPQLHTLEVQTIDCSDPREGDRWLEFAHLGHLLGKHGCIKVLRLLRTKRINPSSHIGSVFDNDPVPLEPDHVKFPVLEELAIPDVETSDWLYGPLTLSHGWWSAVDWSRITKLVIGEIGHQWSDFPVHLMPQVRSLGFDYLSRHMHRPDEVERYVSNAKQLLADIPDLREVGCCVYNDSNWFAVWDSLLLNHGKSLRKLAVGRQRFTAAMTQLLIDRAPGLEELDVVIGLPGLEKTDFDKDHRTVAIFQDECVKALAGLSSLRRLKLTIPMGADHLRLMEDQAKPHRSPSRPKVIKAKDCEQQIGPIFEAFLMQQAQGCKIDTIEVQFDCEDGRELDEHYLTRENNPFKSWKAVMQRNYTAALDDGKPYSVRFQILAGHLHCQED